MPEPLLPIAEPDHASTAVIDLQSAMDLDSVWRSSLRLMQRELPHRSCSLFFGIVDFEPTAAIHHVESPRNPAYRPATSLTISAPFLARHRHVPLYTYSQIVSEDPDARRRRVEQEPDPEWNEFVHLAFWRDERPEAVFSITRAADQPRISSDERGLLEQLHPMLEAGLRRIRAVERTRARRLAYEDCLRRMPVATLLVADDGRLLFANGESERLRTRWNGGLHAADEAAWRLPERLPQLLRQTTGDSMRLSLRHPHIAGLTATIERSAGTAVPGQRPCYVVTLNEAAGAANATTTGRDSEAGRPILDQLTPAERRVALRVVDGLSNDEIATDLGRSRRTVEFQLNTIYRKLGLTRRTQLVRLLG
ncbi:MAG TPA: helix-turn-helix transcriptional regulator [Fontimonas sp.]